MEMDETICTTLQHQIEPILAERAMELVELTCHMQGQQRAIRVLVDKVGGVTIRQCAQVNQLITHALETGRLFDGPYTVEVSSPGLDRPLVTRRDFERAVGEELQVEVLREGDARTQSLSGMLLAVQEDAVVLKTPRGNTTVPLAHVRIAKKALPW